MMEDKNIQMHNNLSDDQLAEVTGGGSFEKGDGNRCFSGDTPLYTRGQILGIVYDRGFFKTAAICTCRVVDVSAEKSGRLWLEFTYTVEITHAPANALECDPTLVGQLVHDVYESALIRNIAEINQG